MLPGISVVYQARNALLSVMPELMFRRVPVGSLMPMQGESTAKGKFNHWEGRSSKRMAVPIRDVTAGQSRKLPVLFYELLPKERTDYSATARGDSARLANSILVRYGSCWVSPSLLNFPRSSARAV
ncbi:hypothetical protein VNO77_49341 [Canavalia gladiata]|uniref:Uncharacterized protein n=1 Tax=Canavalia gladiata TaxID=3824 RepID=A0AAN9JDA2_CANGL